MEPHAAVYRGRNEHLVAEVKTGRQALDRFALARRLFSIVLCAEPCRAHDRSSGANEGPPLRMLRSISRLPRGYPSLNVYVVVGICTVAVRSAVACLSWVVLSARGLRP